MLTITVPETELFDQEKNEFIYVKEQTLSLEHSLVSVSKWESKWKKPWLSGKEMSLEQSLDYIRCMTITQNVNPNTYLALTADLIKQVNDYIDDPMSATRFLDKKKGGRSRTFTSEDIYSLMISYGIPMECQKWHLNRLITLIRVREDDLTPKKKMSPKELYRYNNDLNEQRKKALNTSG